MAGISFPARPGAPVGEGPPPPARSAWKVSETRALRRAYGPVLQAILQPMPREVVRMRIPAAVWAVAGLLATLPLQAQQAVPASLSLEEALDIARSNNPVYLQAANNRDLADWDVRQAYGQLLPSASANSSVTWQGSGEQQFGTLTLGDLGFGNLPSYYLSSYGLSLNYNLNWSTLKGTSSAKAQRAATVAETRVSEATLVSQVTLAYLEVLRQQEAVRLSEQQLENSSFNLRLAQGQLEVGAATPIDVGQAEVQVGRSEVAVLQAENALATARMRLMQQLGVPVDLSLIHISEPTRLLVQSRMPSCA